MNRNDLSQLVGFVACAIGIFGFVIMSLSVSPPVGWYLSTIVMPLGYVTCSLIEQEPTHSHTWEIGANAAMIGFAVFNIGSLLLYLGTPGLVAGLIGLASGAVCVAGVVMMTKATLHRVGVAAR